MDEHVTVRVEFDGRRAATAEATGQPLVVSAGERVTGTAFVSTRASVKVRAVRLVAEWRTHGRGDTDADTVHESTLIDGPTVGGDHAIPFDVAIPVAPLTYYGTLLKIQWRLRVRFDRPFARDWWHDVPIEVV